MLTIKQASEILGVEPSIGKEELSKRWKQLALATHPDLHPEKENEFKKLSEAYETLAALNQLTRASSVIDQDILDDDFRFIIGHLPKKQQKEIMKQLKKIENEDA